MKSKILAVLLLLSILMNIYLIQIQPSSKDLLEMKDKIKRWREKLNLTPRGEQQAHSIY